MSQPQTREACCYAPLHDGRLIEITAVANPASAASTGLAPVKLVDAPGWLQQRLRDVVEAARLTEFNPGQHWQLSFYLDGEAPAEDDRGWELAAVIADRMARGLQPESPGRDLALGMSDAWESGRIMPLDNTEHSLRLNHLQNQLQNTDRLFLAHPGDALAELEMQDLTQADADEQLITHLGGLLGQPDPASAVRRARVWFPLVGARQEQHHLAWVEISVLPTDPDSDSPGAVRVMAQSDASRCQEIVQVLEDARCVDPVHVERWQTLVRFSRWDFSDNSYELALVMADRIARGREVPAPGRVIATGCSDKWSTGMVKSVGGMKEKQQLLQQQLNPGDRLLLPAEWKTHIAEEIEDVALRKQASIAWMSQLV